MKSLGGLPRQQRSQCLEALCDLCEAFGRPHVHSGLGIRKLKPGVFECRGNLDLRFVFFDWPEALYVRFLGNHDEVQALLRSGKF
jgi:hypothetical protein